MLLAAIAVAPVVNKEWWDRYYPFVSIGLGSLTIAYYILILRSTAPVLDSGHDYFSFLALVGSLFVIAGGLHLKLRGRSKPFTNVMFLASGALISNLVGTTGASILLIRPYLRVNHYRIKPFHTIFFIFVVSNIGGALTPIGDPPLFVGYLKGIPFFWQIANLWYIWLFAIATLLAVFYGLDRRDYSRLSRREKRLTTDMHEHGEILGVHNIFFLAVVLCAVFATNPPFLREILMMAAGLGSYLTTPKDVHRKTDFNFGPIKEVSILFFGIFATMIPALGWIRQNSVSFGFEHAAQFYWTSGALSSVLDNTPTYLNFLSAAIGVFVNHGIVQNIFNFIQSQGTSVPLTSFSHSPDAQNTLGALMNYHGNVMASGKITSDQIATVYLLSNNRIIIQAISVGAVFFGAMTYIGNGPNFMVKSIAEQAGVRCPSFISYVVRYSVPVLLPLFVMIWFLFFRT